MRTFRIEGTIERVSWAGISDWPMFRIRVLDGSESDWTREGDIRRYVEGLGVRLCYVEHPWKRPSPEKGLGEASQIVLSIEVEHSPRRSAAVAPGSRGLGYDLARRDGTVRHYLTFPTAERLEWPSASSRGGRGHPASVTIASPAPGSSTCSTAIPARLHACATSSLRSRGDTAARTTAAKSSAAKCGARSSSHNRAQ